VLANVTVSPDDAVALTVKSGSPYVLLPSVPNVIVWFVFPPIVSVPLPVAASVAEVCALTSNAVEPPGVPAVVVIVSVAVLEVWVGVKETGWGLNTPVATVGSTLVTLRLAVNVPALPGPLPLLTVTVYVTVPGVPDVSVPD